MNASERLHALFDLDFQRELTERPEYATYYGFQGHNHRWSDLSRGAIEARKAASLETRSALGGIDPRDLSDEDKLNYDLFQDKLDTAIEGSEFPSEVLQVAKSSGPQSSIPSILAMMRLDTSTELDDFRARLDGVPVLIEQTIDLLREGISKNVTAPRVVLGAVPDQIDAVTSSAPGQVLGVPCSVEELCKTSLTKAAPPLQRLKIFLVDEYFPAARDTVGLSGLPGGPQWYAFLVRRFTTTDLTAQQIHEIGLSEVERIETQMKALLSDVNFSGNLSDFAEFLRTDAQFFFTKPEDLLRAYRDISKRADAELPRFFGKLPRLTYGVSPIPDYSAPSTTTAYYQPGAPAAGRAGVYFANTYDLPSRPSWEMEALSLHEAVPGHHLQIALAQELEGIPEFRRTSLVTAFVEGWGLYAESLGDEMGFYKNPYSKFGKYTYEMWRAIRLVVDTGLHAFGWSREKAIDFFKSHSAKAVHDIEQEIDRYISSPGQALAYKIGELKIKEIRGRAESALGGRFNVRDFHDALLCNGAVPLSTLERLMERWIASI